MHRRLSTGIMLQAKYNANRDRSIFRSLFIPNSLLCVIYVFSYALFFLSIILAPQIILLFENVNVNCISLWSLTILFVNNELKPELCEFIFTKIKKYINGANNQNIS